MIGKTILNFIGLLFIGSQISRVAANVSDLEACDLTGNLNGLTQDSEPTPTSYCLKDNGDGTSSIIGYDATYYKIMDGDVYIFNSSNQLVDPTDVSETGLSIYICSDSNCKRTYGYIQKNSNTFYQVKYDNSDAEEATVENSKAAAECEAGELFKDSGATPKDTIEYCVAPGIGIPVAGNSDEIKNYLATNVGTNDGETIFTDAPYTGTGNKPKLVIQSHTSGFIMNTVYKGSGGVYCDYTTNELYDRMKNYCDGTILNFMYSCSNGVCDQSTSSFSNNDLKIVKIDGKNKIYKCVVEGGYTSFVEENSDGVFAYKTVATDTTYFDLAADGDYTIDDIAKSSLRIFDCHNGECDVTNGYAKFNTNTELGKFTANVGQVTGSWAKIDNTAEVCDEAETTSHVQLAETDLKLCTDTSKTLTTVENGKTYYVKDNSNNYHAYTVNGNVIGASKPNDGFYILNSPELKTANGGTAADDLVSCTGGICTHLEAAAGNYLSGIDKGLIQCSTSTVSNCDLHDNTSGYYLNAVTNKVLLLCNGTSCEEIATTDIGYYKNGESPVEYIQCTASDSCTTVTPDNCSDSNSNGKLTANGELCLKDAISVSMATSGQYLITAGANSIFTTVTNFGVVISDSNKVILDTTVVLPVCAKGSDQKIIEAADEAACISATGTYYSSCNNGLCTVGELACDLTSNSSNGCTAETYYLAAASDSVTAYKNSELADKTAGYVFYCETAEGACGNMGTAGYYVNSVSQAFSCGVVAGSCKPVASIPTDTCAKNGDLVIKNDNEIHLCLNTVGNISVKLDSDDRYYIAKYEEENVFGIVNEGYGLITITAKTAHLKTGYSAAVKYIYAKNSDLQVMIRGETCPAKVAGEYPILEVNCDTNGKCTVVEDN